MIKDYRTLRQFIHNDLKSQGHTNVLRSFLKSPVYRFTYLLRVNEYLFNSGMPLPIRLFPLLWFKRLSIKLGFSVPFNVFGPGLAIVHHGLLIVNPKAQIGQNCRVHAGVNIGGGGGFVEAYQKDKQYAPFIGDNCYIGPGAKIFGPITIPNDCVIGANAVVNKSIDKEGVTIAGVPAVIISENSSEGLIIKGA